MSPNLLICLFGCYHILIIICFFAAIVISDFVTQSLFSSIITDQHLFHFFFFSFGRIQEIEFERQGLPLTIRCIGDPFNISTYYLVLFVLQRVAFCFYFILSLATNTIITPDVIFHLTLFHYDDKRETGVGLTYRCHLSNIMFDSTYNN